MKASTSLAVAALMLATGSASAQSGDMKGMDIKGMDTKSMPMDKTGQVTSYKTHGSCEER